MPKKGQDQGARVLRIRSNEHKALLQKYVELHRYLIENVRGENTVVNRGLVLALEYLMDQGQGWVYFAQLQMHVLSNVKPKPDRIHANMIMGTVVDLTSQATASSAIAQLQRLPSTQPKGRHRRDTASR